ncbi:MAG: UvrB/UvrC motif-containing protein [bacterium]|nr:UvrB/UvrC motif-containing protein [bacterium]
MKWANFLHIYQPANQIDEIFDRVVNESYKPLIKTLKDFPETKITLNINGALSEQFEKRGFDELIKDISFVAERGQIEFTDSAKYHALLPFLGEDEIVRQIKLNNDTNKRIFGDTYNPKGFFPPEMAYSPTLPKILKNLGYEWMIIDEIAFNGKINQIDANNVYKILNDDLFVFFRERSHSNLIMSALVRREQDFQEILGSEYRKKGYIVTGMDGETFGHHRPGLQELLTGLLRSRDFEHVFMSELISTFKNPISVAPITSTWASTELEIEEGKQFLTWKDETNNIHNLQWQLHELAKKVVYEESKNEGEARKKLDKAISSDQFFWASAKPWWSLEVIEAGAWNLLDTVRAVVGIPKKITTKAEELYYKIIGLAFEWQRTGYVRNRYKEYKDRPRIPFKDKTSKDGEPWIYNAFIELLKDAMIKASKKENFEEAILWRDAIWKLETKNDIFESVHAIDILRKQLTNAEILDMIGKYRREYEKLSSGQPEQRS